MGRRKWLFLFPLIPLVLIGAILLVLPLMFDGSSFAFLPQDCPGTSIRLTGTVAGPSGAVVSVDGENRLYPGSSGIDLALITDADGSFDSGNVYLHAFLCEVLTVTISAEGFETNQLRYILLDYFSEDELAALMRGSEPIPVSFEIELRPVQ